MNRPKRKIRIKYCGGCNPRYDRVAEAEKLKKALGNRFVFSGPEEDDVDIVLTVQGCATACADVESFTGKQIINVLSPEDAKSALEDLKNR